MGSKKVALFMLPPLTQAAGAEKYFIELAANLNKRGRVIVDIVTLNKKSFKILARLMQIYYHLDFFKEIDVSGREPEEAVKKRLGETRWVQSSFFQLKNILQEYDLIYAKNEIVELVTLKLLIGYRKLPPIIVGIHTPVYYPYARTIFSKLHNLLYVHSRIYSFLLRGVKRVHVVNNDDKKLLNNIAPVPVDIIHYPFKVPLKKGVKLDSRNFNILFVGRISEQKGIIILLDVIDLLSQEAFFDKLKFRIVGSGEDNLVKEIKTFTKRYHNVAYLGHIIHDKINKLYEWSDVVIIPSLYETVNYVALEAGSCGRIVIASDIPGPRDVIRNGETGFLIPPDPKIFAGKIKDLYLLKQKNRKSFKKIGIMARRYISRKFDPDKLYRRMEYLFLEVDNHKGS
jgi:glycosyltransferase involved in cell wall biosynthesis